MEKAQYNFSYHQAFISLAENEYNVTVSEEELDGWITEGPDQNEFPQQKAYAEALDMTIEELNHEYDRDLYKQTMLMEKLQPVLQEEFRTTDVEDINEKFNEEVEDHME